MQQGRLRSALSCIKRALKAFTRCGEARGVALAALALAQVLHALGRTGRAEALFSRGVSHARRHGIHAHLEVFT